MNLQLPFFDDQPAAAFVPRRGSIPSLIKWTGSKRSQATRIAKLAPSHERYFEPFLGGGALLYLFARPGSVASDVYEPLVRLWCLVRDDPEAIIANYEGQWSALQKELPAYYYEVRSRFNEKPNPEDLNFLMRTCVNGIVRFSQAGQFNNSFHLSRRGMTPHNFAAKVRSWNERLRGVELVSSDYRCVLAAAKSGDFVYMDPPYAGNKQRYVADLDQDAFFQTLDDLNSRGVKWAVSFDGGRGTTDYSGRLPSDLFRRVCSLDSGLSAVAKVLNGPLEQVREALYLNY